MTTIQSLQAMQPVQQSALVTQVEEKEVIKNMPNDKVDISAKANTVQPPEISAARLFFRVLTDEQISQINEAIRLPQNAKFVMNGFGGYAITNNFFNFRAGTKILPEGFEVRKDIFGMAVVLPKGMEGAVLK